MPEEPLYRIQREAMENSFKVRGLLVALVLLVVAIIVLLATRDYWHCTPDCAIH